MTNPVVKVNVSVLTAPAPSVLQKTGAFISSGGTNTSPGTYSLLTQLSDLTPLLVTAAAVSAISYLTGTVTVTATAPHGLPVGQIINLTLAGFSPSGYNGSFPCTITGPSAFTYALPSNPGAETVLGTWIPGEVKSITSRATTFFAQGTGQSVYVLEVGALDATHGVNFLSTWITANPNTFYSYLLPRFWDGNATLLTFLATLESNTAKTYFFVTTTLQNYALYTAQMKDVVLMIEAPAYGAWAANALTALSWSGGQITAVTTTSHGVAVGQWFQLSGCTPASYNGWYQAALGTATDVLVANLATNPGAESVLGTLVQSQYSSAGIGATEFSLAAVFQVTLNYKPSSTNKVTPLQFAYLFGVTPFPLPGNNALITTLLAANVNIVGTGAQGGISNTLVLGGNNADGNPFKYWYSIDWAQINLAQAVTAALINGANNPQNPLDYNQDGINQLQQVCVSTMATGISDALVLNPLKPLTLDAADFAAALSAGTYDGNTLVNADPFASYVAENPLDYGTGTYNGLSIDYTPLRGFESITINVAVSNFAL
jgi:hypothetical protein